MLNVISIYGLTKSLSPVWELTTQKSLAALRNLYRDVFIGYITPEGVMYSSIYRLIAQYHDTGLNLDGLLARITQPLSMVNRLPCINLARYRSSKACGYGYRPGACGRYFSDSINTYDYNDILLQTSAIANRTDFADYCLFNVSGYLHYGKRNTNDSWIIDGLKTLKQLPLIDDFGIWSFRDIGKLTITPFVSELLVFEDNDNVVINVPVELQSQDAFLVIGGKLLPLTTLGVQRASDSVIYVNQNKSGLIAHVNQMKKDGLLPLDAGASDLFLHTLSYLVSVSKKLTLDLVSISHRLPGCLRLTTEGDFLMLDDNGRTVNYWTSLEDGVKLLTFNEPEKITVTSGSAGSELFTHHAPLYEKHIVIAYSY
jgi:hypothetical protein